MIEFPDKIKHAISELTHLPGVGEKTSTRMVLSMMKWKDRELEAFSKAVFDLKNLSYCQECGVFCEEIVCEICSDVFRRDSKLLCIVENISDLMAVEKSGNFQGTYHILGGVLNPLLGVGPDELKLEDVKSKIIERGITDVILAINPSVEGDATCSYFKLYLPSTINIERIGFGVPIGGTLEYLDPLTISKALENRKRF
jgi:recombination protein RecR